MVENPLDLFIRIDLIMRVCVSLLFFDSAATTICSDCLSSKKRNVLLCKFANHMYCLVDNILRHLNLLVI